MQLHNSALYGISIASMCIIAVANANEKDSHHGSGFRTPQNAVAAYRNAVATQDWPAVYACYTPFAQRTALAEMLYSIAASGSPERLAIGKSHGIDFDAIDKKFVDQPPSSEDYWQALIDSVNDGSDFFTAFRQHAHRQGRIVSPIVEVRRFAIREKWAQSFVSILDHSVETDGVTGQKARHTIFLRKIKGRWFIATAAEWRARSKSVRQTDELR